MSRTALIAMLCAALLALPARAFDRQAWQDLEADGSTAVHAYDWAAAEAAYRKALALDPSGDQRGETLRHLALALHMQRKFSEAQALLTEALELAEKRDPVDDDLVYELLQRLRTTASYSGDEAVAQAVAAKLQAVETQRILNAFEVDDEDHTLKHRLSGAVFEGVYGPFGLAGLKVTQRDGTDVSLVYDTGDDGGPSELTINLTKLDVPVAAHMDVALQAIRMKYPGAEETLSDRLAVATAQGPLDLERHVFAVAGAAGEPMLTAILIGRRGGFHIKFRLTYPVAAAAAIEPAFDALLKGFVWPAG